jgi:hypothetical protein
MCRSFRKYEEFFKIDLLLSIRDFDKKFLRNEHSNSEREHFCADFRDLRVKVEFPHSFPLGNDQTN